jgi:sulfur-oxidizing protein SoxX
MKRILLTPLFLLLLILASCDFGPNTGHGFSLPEGNVEAGRATFVELECNRCPSAGDIERVAGREGPDLNVMLGGPVTSVKTYGDLVASVINPSHKISRRFNEQELATGDNESKMVIYNDVMTVQQLVDIVTWLESEYKIIPVSRTPYPRHK